MLVLIAVIPVPLNVSSVRLSPPIKAYAPFGFHAAASKSNVVPVANERTVVPSYVNANPALPTKSAYPPLGFQLIARMVDDVLGIVVTETPSYLNRIPDVPPTSAKEPSGFQETVQKLNPVEIPVETVVSDVPSYLRRTAKSPDINA